MGLSLFLLSSSTLIFEITLTRLFSVAQFYHFATVVVGLALLGFGASGTLLALFPQLRERGPARLLPLLAWGFALATVGSYAFTLYVPFDSFRVARDWRQVAVLALHYVALSLPFFCSGTATGLLLAVHPGQANRTYAANLAGSACGCLVAVAAPSLVGGEGTVLLAAALGCLAALGFQCKGCGLPAAGPMPGTSRITHYALRAAQALLVLALTLSAFHPPPFLTIRLSPYKSLSYALLLPDAELVSQRWNGFSRVDVVRSGSIRSLPGRGFRCVDLPPPQLGLSVDGDGLAPISRLEPGFAGVGFTDCLLTALPYRLRPGARALVLEPRGGFEAVVALAEGASHVTAVEANPLVVDAVRAQGEWAGSLYDDPRVALVVEEGRAFARRVEARYDVVALALTAPQRPIASGAYSLVEDYACTVEAFRDYVGALDDGGLLVITRWLQVPPSESIRAFALAVEAIERSGGDPRSDLVALRSTQQLLVLARRGPFTDEELEAVRAFAAPRAFDLVYLPGIRPDEVNRYNVLPEPDYARACRGLLEAEDRDAWYAAYPFDVAPPTDDRPFFGHFFKWGQVGEVLAMAGHVWQPFGGAGYLVLLIQLALAVLAAGALILLPLAARRNAEATRRRRAWTLGYFALLGLGYLCVEIPLLQRFVLFLGHPAYAMAAVLFALLLFSGLGSLLSHRVPLGPVLACLPLLVVGYVLGLPVLFDGTLGLPPEGRLAVSVAALAPLGFLMGIPFPRGLGLLEREAPGLVAWAWAANGAVSVVASILASLLALSSGFSAVLALGAACYLGAWGFARSLPRKE